MPMTPEIFTMTDILISMGVMSVPVSVLLIFINYKVRMWEKKDVEKREAEKIEREEVKQAAKEEALEVKRIAEETAAQVKREAKANAELRTQENMCIIRAIRDTGSLSRIITVATKAQVNGEKLVLNGDVDKALNQYDNTMKELDEFLLIQNAKNR